MQVPSNLIPSRITQLLEDPAPSGSGWMVYSRDGVSYKVQASSLLNITGVPPSRAVIAGTGLQGGGALSTDVTLSVAPGGIGGAELSNTGVTSGVYGSSTRVPSFTVNAQGRVESATTFPIASVAGGTVSSVDVSGGTTGLTTTGGPVTDAGVVTLGGTLNVLHGGTGATTASAARTNLSAAVLGANADITSLSGITGGVSTVDYIDFDTAAPGVRATGRLWWDSADGVQTLNIGMAGSNATLQVGEEAYFRIKASSAITEAQVVMFTGSVGASGALTGAPATGLTPATAQLVMGLATENIALNGWGYVTEFGLVRGINTTGSAVGEVWADGDILYYNPSVVGGLTKTIPVAPNAKVVVAAVVHVHVSVGSLFVRPSFGGILGQYEGDVNLVSPANGQLLIRDQTAGVWKNATLTDGSGVSVTEGAGSVTVALATAYGDTANPYASKTAKYFLAAPNGVAGVPSFRAIVASDVPTLNQSTTGTAAGLSVTLAVSSGGTNSTAVATAGGAAYGSGTAILLTAAGTAGQVLTSGGVAAPAWANISGGTF